MVNTIDPVSITAATSWPCTYMSPTLLSPTIRFNKSFGGHSLLKLSLVRPVTETSTGLKEAVWTRSYLCVHIRFHSG